MNITVRFSEYMKANNILQKDIAELLRKTTQAVSGILSGKSDFTSKQLVLIAEKYKNLNIRWLLTGFGEMLTSYTEIKPVIDVVNENYTFCRMCAEKDKRILELELHRDDLRRELGKIKNAS